MSPIRKKLGMPMPKQKVKFAEPKPNYTSPMVSWSSLHPGQTGIAAMVKNPNYKRAPNTSVEARKGLQKPKLI